MPGCSEIPAVVREASDREAFELALVENLQREDLNPIEEAEAYELLVDRPLASRRRRSPRRVGKERSTVANALRLLKLPEDVRDAVRDGQLDMGHARALLGLESAEAMAKAAAARHPGGALRPSDRGVGPSLSSKPPKKPAPGAKGDETPALRDLTQRLQRRLGTRCKIVPRSAVAGKLEVEYSSLDEFDGILARIGA